MRLQYLMFPFLIVSLSCNPEFKEELDPSPNADVLDIQSSNDRIPFNEYGFSKLSARTNLGTDVTTETIFYVNGERVENNIFRPTSLGEQTILGRYKDLESAPIEVNVEQPLNKKVLVESFTSRICAWCPWIGYRIDSLHNENKKVIGYSIHGQDEFEIENTQALQENMQVYSRPAVRINRGFVRNFAAPIEIIPLVDSIHYFLSFQPKAELSIKSTIAQNSASVVVWGKFYESPDSEVYLSVFLVEDNLISPQDNAFAGGWKEGCPYTNSPNPIQDYKNHHILRQVVSRPLGDFLNVSEFEAGEVLNIGEYSCSLSNLHSLEEAWIIASIHRNAESIEFSSVLNSQIVKLGSEVDFDE